MAIKVKFPNEYVLNGVIGVVENEIKSLKSNPDMNPDTRFDNGRACALLEVALYSLCHAKLPTISEVQNVG